MVKQVEEIEIPRGKCKSGRIWKTEQKETFRTVKKSNHGKSFEATQKLRAEMRKNKELSRQLKEEKRQQSELLRQRQEENKKRKEENARKSEVVQVVKNAKSIKKTRKKHLRKV